LGLPGVALIYNGWLKGGRDKILRLTLIPRLEFADGVSRVSELLSIYPKEQTTKDRPRDPTGREWGMHQETGENIEH
jgi:hypothetical protein